MFKDSAEQMFHEIENRYKKYFDFDKDVSNAIIASYFHPRTKGFFSEKNLPTGITVSYLQHLCIEAVHLMTQSETSNYIENLDEDNDDDDSLLRLSQELKEQVQLARYEKLSLELLGFLHLNQQKWILFILAKKQEMLFCNTMQCYA